MNEVMRLAESVFPYLRDAVCQATALAAIVLILSRFLGKRRLAARYWFSVYCLVGVFLLPITPFVASGHRLALLPAEQPQTGPAAASEPLGLSPVATGNLHGPVPDIAPGGESELEPSARVALDPDAPAAAFGESALSASQGPPAGQPERLTSAFAWRGWISLAWLAGCTVFLARLLLAAGCVVLLRRSSSPVVDASLAELFEATKKSAGFRTRVQLRIAKSLASPAAIGLFRPTILLPESLLHTMPPEQLRPILLHELAHVRWNDYAVNMLQRVGESLLFFHPLVWYLSRRLRVFREEICDNWVLDRHSNGALYARALTELAGRTLRPCPSRLAAIGLFSHGTRIRARVERILSSAKRPPTILRLKTALLLLLVSFILVVSLSLTTFSARAVPPAAEPAAKGEPATPLAAPTFGDKVTVAADGSGDTRSIQQALDGVDEQGTVFIKPGTYREHLVLSKPVSIEGAGRDLTRIEASSPAQGDRSVAVRIHDCKPVSLKGLTIVCGTRLGERSGLVLLEVTDAGVDIAECNLLWAQYGVTISGDSNARMERCLVAGIWRTGIAIGADASATVTNCEVRNCYHRCITVRSNSDVRIENNLISGSAWHGIRYDHCSPTIVGNVLNNHARFGIYASGSGEARILNNLFLRNDMSGVSTWGRTNPLIRNNTFVENKRGGLEMDATTRPVVENNIFFANETAAGRFCTSSSRPVADSSPPPELSHNLLSKNAHETPSPPRPIPEVVAEYRAQVAKLEVELADMRTKFTDAHPEIARKRAQIQMLTSIVKRTEEAAPYKPPELSFSDTALRDDPLFLDADADNYNVLPNSPCRGAGKDGADIGAKLTVSVKSQYPITPEEKMIIPDSDSRDSQLWKKGPTSSPSKAVEGKPPPPVERPSEVVINVTKDGKLLVGEAEKSIEEINEMLRHIAEERPDTRVIVRAHPESPYKSILHVLDACSKANLSNVSVAVTDKEREPEKPQPIPVPPAEAKAGEYVPPDYEGYFPDDPEGGRKLDALAESGVFQSTLPDEEILEIVRRGLRRTTQSYILRALGNRYIWGKHPQNQKAIEVMYHATGGPRFYNAIYFGLSVVEHKSPSILRRLVEICIREDDPNVLHRVAWGTRSQRSETLPYLAPYLNSSDEATREKARIVEKILKGELKAFAWATEKARAKAKAEFTDKLPEIKEQLLHGDSDTRSEVLKLIGRNAITLIMDDSFIEAWKSCAADPDPGIRNEVARTFGNRWIWGAPEQKPEAIDLMLQLSKDEVREVRYNAVYFGLSTVRDKSEAVVKRLLEIAMADREWNMFSRIQWGLRGSEATAARILEDYMDQDTTDPELAAAAFGIYEDIVGKPAPHPERFQEQEKSEGPSPIPRGSFVYVEGDVGRPGQFSFSGQGAYSILFRNPRNSLAPLKPENRALSWPSEPTKTIVGAPGTANFLTSSGSRAMSTFSVRNFRNALATCGSLNVFSSSSLHPLHLSA